MTVPYFKSIVPPGDFTSLTRADLAGSIPDRFNEIAAHNPQQTAVCDHVKSLTYLELQRRVSTAAAIIRRAMGPSASAKGVGLIFDPSVESVVGILGVLASGNLFCPLSPHDPPARVRIYLEDAEIDVILPTRPAFPDRLQSELRSEQIIFVDELPENDVETVAPATPNPHQLAAILYTSGSTGIPKGVTHTHETFLHMVRIKGNAFGTSPSDRIAGLSTFTFGSSKTARLTIKRERGNVSVWGVSEGRVYFELIHSEYKDQEGKIFSFESNPDAYFLEDYDEVKEGAYDWL